MEQNTDVWNTLFISLQVIKRRYDEPSDEPTTFFITLLLKQLLELLDLNNALPLSPSTHSSQVTNTF